MRRTLILLLLVLGGASLASCGKGNLTTTTTSSASSASAAGSSAGGSNSPGGATNTSPNGDTGTSPSSPPSSEGQGSPSQPKGKSSPSEPAPSEPAPSRERALAFAQAVNLTAEDVPGFAASDKHDSSSAHEKRLEREMVRCAGGGAGLGAAGASVAGEHKSVAEQGSKEFQLKHGIVDLSVSSEVSVQASAAEARRGLQAIRSPKVRSCFSHYLQLLFQGERLKGATPGPVTVQAGTPPAPGTAGGFGWRITASFNVKGIKVPIYLDFLGFVNGPAEVTLLSSGLLRPFPAEVQQQLFALLLKRAKQHAL